MRKTLLEIVQLILSSMDSDEVNTISDTIESTQVAKIVESTYYDMITDITMPEHQTAFQLNASLDSSKPCMMIVPQNVTHIDEVRYNYQLSGELMPDYRVIQYQPVYDFIMFQQALRNDTTGVATQQITMNNEVYDFIYRTNVMPSYYTTIDNNIMLFDAYDVSEDTTLQKSKTLCRGTVYPVFMMEDTFYPKIDPTQFSLLINRAKVRAFQELKQQANPEAAGEARRQKIIVQKRKRKVPGQLEIFRAARFGRK